MTAKKGEGNDYTLMEFLFNLIGSILGYVLWFAFYLVKNYGIAIILFTLFTKILLFPFSIKQQKSMASNARFQQKQKEIMDKYKNDRVRANEEIQKLMQKENVSPMAGCLPMLAPMIIMFGVWYSVRNPLTNTLHIAADKVSSALNSVNTLPGLGVSINSTYGEISIAKYFGALQKYLVDGNGNLLFNPQETEKINEFSNGFNFLGLDLLATPSQSAPIMMLIPVLCFVTSVLSMFLTQKINGTKMQGCMVMMIVLMPLMTAFIAYSVPAAVGFYWISSTVLGFFQSLIMNKFYSSSILEARAEAERIVLRLEQESQYAYIDVPDYVAPSKKATSTVTIEKTAKSGNKNKKSKKSGNNNNSSYQGKKK